MKYLVKFVVDTDAPVEAVRHNFNQMSAENTSHELEGPNDDYYSATLSEVEVREIL